LIHLDGVSGKKLPDKKFSLDRIVPARMKRVAAQESAQAHPATAQGSVTLNCLESIF
jgi:hypothetical protein